MWSSFDLVCHKNVLIIRNFNRISSRSYTKDYYNVLDIKRNSSRREIKHAYYRLSKKFHPDVNSEKNAEEKFKMIQEAYQVLGDDKKRLEYDMSLDEGYYPSGSRPKRENAGFTARSYAKRTGPIHTGSTSAYNFDEYYKSHYGSTFKKAPTGGFAKHHSSKTMNEEELKNYWNTKEFSDENDFLIHKRSEYFIKSIVVGASLILVYVILRKFKESEEELGRRTYLQNTQRINTKD